MNGPDLQVTSINLCRTRAALSGMPKAIIAKSACNEAIQKQSRRYRLFWIANLHARLAMAVPPHLAKVSRFSPNHRL